MKKTKQDLVQPLLTPCLAATTFGALSSCLREGVERLQRLDCFKNIDVIVDRIKDDPAGHDVKVVLEVEEKRFKLHAGTEVKRNDIAFTVNGQLYNVFGRAERLDAAASVGSHTTAPLSLSFTKPLKGSPDRLINFSAGSFSSAFPSGARFCHSSHYTSAAYQLAGALPNSKHEFKYGLDWRTVYGMSPLCSPTIRRAAGHSLKSAFQHTLTIDSRDDQVFPTNGHFLRWSKELAGGSLLGGDAGHFKQELFGSLHMALPKLPNCVLSLSMHAGQLMPYNGNKSFILDRFKLGGPNSVRGFSLNSIGPKDQDDPLGGDLALEAGASLSFPLAPSLAHIVRGQVFANIGMLTLNHSALSIKEQMSSFLTDSKPHVSVGGGLLFKMGPSTRLELNLALPIHTHDATFAPRGIQLGLGVEFL